MLKVKPEHSRRAVDRAGEVFTRAGIPASPDEAEDLFSAYTVVNNWRSAHSFPLNTFQTNLRANVPNVSVDGLVAQRLKRHVSIRAKLRNEPWLKLSKMQDIGGVRAVMGSIDEVQQLVQYYEQSQWKHKLARKDDYLVGPRPSGYRGIHLVYQYYSDRNDTYNDLRIEMQIRTRLEHAWATAVEAVGAFSRQALKSSLGDEEWLRFFALMGSVIAMREDCALVPGTPESRADLVKELRYLAEKLNVEGRLNTYRSVLEELENVPRNAEFFLLELQPDMETISIIGYRRGDIQIAVSEYELAEQRLLSEASGDAVLVRVRSIADLRTAYPNYFADTTVFIDELQRAIV